MAYPRHIGSLLKELFEELGILDDMKTGKLLREWKNIVGETVAKYAKPIQYENGVLWLEVEDPTWRMEIYNISEILIDKINEKLGEKLVRRIRID